MNFQAWVITGGRRADIPAHPPARLTAIVGERRETDHDEEELCDLIVDGAGQAAEERVNQTTAAESSTLCSKLQPSSNWNSFPSA